MNIRIKTEILCSGPGCDASFEKELDLGFWLPDEMRSGHDISFALKQTAETIGGVPGSKGWIWSRGSLYCPACAELENRHREWMNQLNDWRRGHGPKPAELSPYEEEEKKHEHSTTA
jgi:hypothetical protein